MSVRDACSLAQLLSRSLGQYNVNDDKTKLLGQLAYSGSEELSQIQVTGIVRDASGAFVGNYLAFVSITELGTEASFEASLYGDRSKTMVSYLSGIRSLC